jgi:predicted RNase H-like HicB family nuclease
MEGSMIGKTIRRIKRQDSLKGRHRLQLTAVIERTRGGYVATCPQLQGCYTQGRTYEEVMRNIRDAIRLHLEDRLAVGDPLPAAGDVTLAVLDVAV